jgi:hypothetical protein
VIDPIIAFIGQGEDLHKATDMTQFLIRIDSIASEFGCAIVIIRHLRKSGDGDVIRRGLGSIAIAGRVRSGLAVRRHPDDPEARVIAHHKSNYDREGATILFSLVQSGNVARVEWLGVDETLSASALFEVGGQPGRPSTESARVRIFLETQLAGGACASADVFRAAERRNLAKVTVERTSREMKIVKRRKGQESYWQLPEGYGHNLEDDEQDDEE